MNTRTYCMAWALVMLATGSALAHDFWIEASAFYPAKDQLLQIHLRVGHVDESEDVTRNPERIEEFIAVVTDDRIPIMGQDGKAPAGIYRPEREGLHIVCFRTNHARIELEAEKFEAYLKEEGLEPISAMRAERGESAKAARELYSRCAKSLICMGDAGKQQNDKPTGLPLEIVALRNPGTLKPGEQMPVQIMLNGKPCPGVKVSAKNQKHPHGAASGRTDAEGKANLTLDAAGVWLITAVFMTQAPPDSGADWESTWASLTFQVGEP